VIARLLVEANLSKIVKCVILLLTHLLNVNMYRSSYQIRKGSMVLM